MTYLEFLKDNAHKLVKPFQTKFRFKTGDYSTKKEFYTILTILGLLTTLIITNLL